MGIRDGSRGAAASSSTIERSEERPMPKMKGKVEVGVGEGRVCRDTLASATMWSEVLHILETKIASPVIANSGR
jgi:hypothetical protein